MLPATKQLAAVSFTFQVSLRMPTRIVTSRDALQVLEHLLVLLPGSAVDHSGRGQPATAAEYL